jgi:DNA/RNA-binding domain of Phe-tRNA-synthetase-like protein
VTSRGDAGAGPAPEPEGPPALGWIAADVEDEFPELALVTVEVPCSAVRTAPWVVHRLTQLANRMTGAYALRVRTLPVPAAHRAFHRQLGLDPDVDRPPLEEAVFRRLWTGGFVPAGMPADALLIALLETGVGVWAVDTAHVEGELGVRTSRAGETLGVGRAATALGEGELVIADAARPVARLLVPPPPAFGVTPETRRAVLYVLQIPGVPAMAVQEALNTARDLLRIA